MYPIPSAATASMETVSIRPCSPRAPLFQLESTFSPENSAADEKFTKLPLRRLFGRGILISSKEGIPHIKVDHCVKGAVKYEFF